jgi:two-component system, cell cycle sensor histidine kinase and response regulator CckA
VDSLPAGGYSTISVADSGTPIGAEDRARIFDPLFLSEDRTAGLGLGLSIVDGIVRQSGGMVQLLGDQAMGTTFRVLLPQTPRPGVQSTHAISEGHRSGSAVLLADDDPAVRAYAARVLRGAGIRVIEAADGVRALALWTAHRNDIALVLADLEMPGMDGAELVRRVRAEAPEARALFVSAYLDAAQWSSRTDVQGAAFLPKPFSPEMLLMEVERELRTD